MPKRRYGLALTVRGMKEVAMLSKINELCSLCGGDSGTPQGGGTAQWYLCAACAESDAGASLRAGAALEDVNKIIIIRREIPREKIHRQSIPAALRAWARAAGHGGGYHPQEVEALLRNLGGAPITFTAMWVAWLVDTAYTAAWQRHLREGGAGGPPNAAEVALCGGAVRLTWVSCNSTTVELDLVAPQGVALEPRGFSVEGGASSSAEVRFGRAAAGLGLPFTVELYNEKDEMLSSIAVEVESETERIPRMTSCAYARILWGGQRLGQWDTREGGEPEYVKEEAAAGGRRY
jgi:hypothetical protein